MHMMPNSLVVSEKYNLISIPENSKFLDSTVSIPAATIPLKIEIAEMLKAKS